MHRNMSSTLILLFLCFLHASARADQILKTSGFSNCQNNASIMVNTVDIEYNNANQSVTFNVAGTSTKITNVTAILNVTAYGNSVYSNSFNPCSPSTYVPPLCPVPAGSFSASGVQAIPSAYASLVPAIAFQIPDIAAQATLQLKQLDSGANVACVSSQVSNGKTVSVPAVSYVAVGVAGAAIVLAGASALSAAAAGGAAMGGGTVSPSFGDIIGVFQGIAMNGMLNVNYPPIYRAFSKNFAFSTGLIPWTAMQNSIDQFRQLTGGNLANDNVQYLKNATLVFNTGGSSGNTTSSLKRSIETLSVMMRERDITTNVNSTVPSTSNSSMMPQVQLSVSGISAYVEELSLPQANTFMTVLLIVAIIIAAIVVGILAFKLVLEIWALFASFPGSLTGFRKHYWGTMARSIVQLIFILYGIWTLYCIFQFTHGDSWAAMVLAGVTLASFTGILLYFSIRIWWIARRYKLMEGDARRLYYDKETWLRYSLFYEAYRKSFWWTFIPIIVYSFAKGVVLAGTASGLTQTIAQLVLETLMFLLLIVGRPYERKSGNIINIFIAVVRVLSVVCILVFVEELGIAQSTQTITGVVLIALQSALTGTLAILLGVNMIVTCCRENPHRKRRKEAEKRNRDDNLTPLDARNTLLFQSSRKTPSFAPTDSGESFDTELKLSGDQVSTAGSSIRGHGREGSLESLVGGAAPLGRHSGRQPTVPNAIGIQGYGGYRGVHY